MYVMWDEEMQQEWPSLSLSKCINADLVEFTVYNSINMYIIIAYVAILTVRTPWWTNYFSILLPCIGLVMTLLLSYISKYSWWSYSSWSNKYATICVVGYIWTVTMPFSTSHTTWMIGSIFYMFLCPIYYSVTAYDLNRIITNKSTRGITRGVVMAIGGLPLFSIQALMQNNIQHGYTMWDLFQLTSFVIANIWMTLRRITSST